MSNDALPFRQARTVDVGGAAVLAQRITYVGELGYELYVPPAWAVQVWDRLMCVGAEHGITPGGYRVLESLRLEKGYRYFGTDLTSSDTPYESGLGFCVALDKGEFNGRVALMGAGAQRPQRRLRTLTVGGDEYLTDLRRRGGPPRWVDRGPRSQLRLRVHGAPQRGAGDRARRPRRGNAGDGGRVRRRGARAGRARRPL